MLEKALLSRAVLMVLTKKRAFFLALAGIRDPCMHAQALKIRLYSLKQCRASVRHRADGRSPSLCE